MSSLLAARPQSRRSTGAHRRPSESFLGLGLGLTGHEDERGEIDRLFGLRHGRMVEIRLTAIESASTVNGCESVVWLLTSTTVFECALDDRTAMPSCISAAIGDVPLFAPIWQGVRISGGASGLVAVRSVGSPLPQAFQHDLWLLERIAANLGTVPLPAGDLATEPLPGAAARAARRGMASGLTTRHSLALAG